MTYALAHVAMSQVAVRAQLRHSGSDAGLTIVLQAPVVLPIHDLFAHCVGLMDTRELLPMCVKVSGVASLVVDCMLILSGTSAIPVFHWATVPLNAIVGTVAKRCATRTMARYIAGTACGDIMDGNRNDLRKNYTLEWYDTGGIGPTSNRCPILVICGTVLSDMSDTYYDLWNITLSKCGSML